MKMNNYWRSHCGRTRNNINMWHYAIITHECLFSKKNWTLSSSSSSFVVSYQFQSLSIKTYRCSCVWLVRGRVQQILIVRASNRFIDNMFVCIIGQAQPVSCYLQILLITIIISSYVSTTTTRISDIKRRQMKLQTTKHLFLLIYVWRGRIMGNLFLWLNKIKYERVYKISERELNWIRLIERII